MLNPAHRGNMKAQSAMEYLMTYGWAILIIAVVLGALYALGIFGTTNILGTSCRPVSNSFNCFNPSLTGSNSNTLSFDFSQGTGVTMYSTGFACVTTGNVPVTYYGSNTVNPGTTFAVTGIPCPNSAGGDLWVTYNSATATGPTVTTQVAVVT